MHKRYGDAGLFSLYQGCLEAGASSLPSSGTEEVKALRPKRKASLHGEANGRTDAPTTSLSTTDIFGRRFSSSQRSTKHLAGKLSANELASSGDSIEPASRRSTPGPLPGAHLLVPVSEATVEQSAEFRYQHGIPEGRKTYAAAVDVSIAPSQPGELSRPTTYGFTHLNWLPPLR